MRDNKLLDLLAHDYQSTESVVMRHTVSMWRPGVNIPGMLERCWRVEKKAAGVNAEEEGVVGVKRKAKVVAAAVSREKENCGKAGVAAGKKNKKGAPPKPLLPLKAVPNRRKVG